MADQTDMTTAPAAAREGARASKALRPFLVALAALAVLDLVLRLPVFPAFPDDYRTPRASSTALDEFIGWQARRPGVRVAVVGDSVTQGYLVRRSETYPARADGLYEAAGRDVNVHDLALTAARGPDHARVMERLAEKRAADVIALQFDYVFYSDGATATARFPDLFRDQVLPASVEALLGDEVRRAWRLAGSRDWIDAVLFDGTPGSVLRSALESRGGALQLGGQRARHMGYDDINPDYLRKTWRVPRFDDANVQIAAVRRGLAAAREAGVPVVLFIAPLNRDLAEHHGLYDDAVYRANVAYLRAVAAEEGARLVDLSAAVPPEHMIDSVHLLPVGHADLAAALAEAIEPEVAAAERRRGAR